MVDCHIHMVLDGVNWKDAIARHKAAPQEALIRQTLGHYQALGFSYLRDGGDRWGVCDLAAKLAPEYGIRYRSPGFPIYKTGHYGGFIGRGFDGLAEYRALVREAKTRGAHFIKLMISGLMDFNHYGVVTFKKPFSAEKQLCLFCAARVCNFVENYAKMDGGDSNEA